MATNENLLFLAQSYNERDSCARCQGFGFVHSVGDRHDKPPTLRCKKCISCPVCSGSGFTVGKRGCVSCSALGHLHPAKAPRSHSSAKTVKCIDCITCKDCNGVGVVDKNASKQPPLGGVRSQIDPSSAAGISDGAIVNPMVSIGTSNHVPLTGTPPTWSVIHPHLLQAAKNMAQANFIRVKRMEEMGIVDTGSKRYTIQVTGDQTKSTTKPIFAAPAIVLPEKEMCPICKGHGFKHDTNCHKPKQGIRCKHCIDCKACSATGSIVGKRACSLCDTKGFFHHGDRHHDAPANLRCFFCITCTDCKGVGIVASSFAVGGNAAVTGRPLSSVQQQQQPLHSSNLNRRTLT